jgi:hypothetical protein
MRNDETIGSIFDCGSRQADGFAQIAVAAA